MTTKLIVRAIDANGEMLGWAEVYADMFGDGNLTVARPTVIPIEQEGLLAFTSVHWCDVNVEIRTPTPHRAVSVGHHVNIPAPWVAIVVGPPAGGLPPITVRTPIEIGLPVGQLGGGLVH